MNENPTTALSRKGILVVPQQQLSDALKSIPDGLTVDKTWGNNTSMNDAAYIRLKSCAVLDDRLPLVAEGREIPIVSWDDIADKTHAVT